MRRKQKALCIFTAAVLMAGVAPPPSAGAAGNQSCLAGDACVSWVGAGSVYRGWTQSVISNLNSYTFNNGAVVGNNAGYGRNRDASWRVVCFFGSTNYTGGYSGEAPYFGASWVAILPTSESYASTNGLCI
jgi:hypothetical protein